MGLGRKVHFSQRMRRVTRIMRAPATPNTFDLVSLLNNTCLQPRLLLHQSIVSVYTTYALILYVRGKICARVVDDDI
jgi:hypothetical protein